ncbi:MAG: DUF92 domain-containing protein [Anaerolineae bacterium]|nr:DUF92 domain-containing protein [Anaerolineae bacterium]MDW8099312.1 DUF92 domain-containing protein [Anaerolineae bacterium]
MPWDWGRIGLGLLLSLVISLTGYRMEALSGSGAIGATLVGTLTVGLGGWLWGWLLVVFFVSSSLLSRFRLAEKTAIQTHFAKGGRRDLGQVLANGGLGAALAAIAVLAPSELIFAAYLGTLAAVNADTWATELGVLSRQRPRLITTGRVVPAGTSGGVTALGFVAALAGGLLIGLAAWTWAQVATLTGVPLAHEATWWPLWAAVGGWIGALCDSLLGATVQATYWCDRCQKETERAVHHCGTPTRRLRGWIWLSNDGVNFLCSLTGGLVTAAWALWWL